MMNGGIILRLRERLGQRVSGQSLAVFRILFGALILWDSWRYIVDDRISNYWVAPQFHFSYPGFGWVAPLPEPWIQTAWLALGLSAFLVMIGLFYRIAIVALTILFSYFFLLDEAQYLNHFYLVILFGILLCALPAHRVWSVDSLLRRPSTPDVPYAAVFILRLQMEVMLLFAGLVKLTPDWLAGEPLGMWLRRRADYVPFGGLFEYDAVILAAAWGTVALHVVGAPLLLWRRTRLAVVILYCIFHTLNSIFFNIGIFPWLTIGATLIFFDPDWPGQLLSHFRRWTRSPAPAVASPKPSPTVLPRYAFAAIVVWAVIQVALPLRSLAFSSEVRWAGDGHRFSWRMRIFDRKAKGHFRIVSKSDGTQWVIDPKDYLTRRQISIMLTRPDMIHQFARYLAARWKDAGHGEVAVYADIRKSLNGRPMQVYIDPSVDLASAPYNLFAPDPWVLKLEQPVWGLEDNRRAAAASAVGAKSAPVPGD